MEDTHESREDMLSCVSIAESRQDDESKICYTPSLQ